MQAGRWRGAMVPLLALGLALAACGGDDEGASTTAPPATTSPGDAPTTTAAAGGGATLKVGYSAWPGWFPLAVTEEQGLFAEAGVEVELIFFADYIASLDALATGSIDVNTQTLNDTIFSVAAGSPQKIFATNDNSTGNDAIICDASIGSIADLEGKSIAAEPGVVTHFLLLQGLADEELGPDDIEFQGLANDAAAAAFAGGQFDCVAVYAPATTAALARADSKVLFSSADYPGAISDHFVATVAAYEEHSAELQALVEAWYLTLEWIEENPDEAIEIMAAKAGVTPEEYADYAAGTTIFTAEQALDSFEDRPGDRTSLPEMARRINPFLLASGLTEEEADLADLFAPEFTAAHVAAAGG